MYFELGRTWAEIDLDSIVYNYKTVRSIIGEKTILMAVVKANAYGHGSVEISRILEKNGADRLAVATVDEAIELRNNGIYLPIQILGYTSPKRIGDILEFNLVQTVFDIGMAEQLSSEAEKKNRKAVIHIKLNTGMNRLGFRPNQDSIKSITKICRMTGIEVEGLMTHFSSCDEIDCEYTNKQFILFMDFDERLRKNGVVIPIRHVSNSAAVVNYPEMNLEMVRPGIILYGLTPSSKITKDAISLKPVMSLKSRIAAVNHVNKGECLSYGRTYRTERGSIIATIPIGYADGYPRILSNKSRVILYEEYAPLVGTICMDYCMVDITSINEKVSVGDEVVLMGVQERKCVTAEELADRADTIGYEIVCRIGSRVPRVYLTNSNIVKYTTNV